MGLGDSEEAGIRLWDRERVQRGPRDIGSEGLVPWWMPRGLTHLWNKTGTGSWSWYGRNICGRDQPEGAHFRSGHQTW